MNAFVSHQRTAICSLLLLVESMVAAFGQAQTTVSKHNVLNVEKLHQGIKAAVTAGEDRDALETYEKRNVEIAPWVENALPPNPDNAALLYYQAFVLRPEPDAATAQKIQDVLRGAEPDRRIRTYLGHCLPMIRLAEIASQIPQCTWGTRGGAGPNFGWKDLNSDVNRLLDILIVDARTLAADGHYRAALEDCLTLRSLSHHLSEDPRLELAARNPDVMALRTIQYVLGVMPPDADTLMWLRARLALVRGLRLSFAEMLQTKSKSFFNRMRSNPGTLTWLKDLLAQNAQDEQGKKNAQKLTGEQLLSRARESFPRFVDSIIRVVDGGMTYNEKLAQMKRLIKGLQSSNADPVTRCVVLTSGIDGLVDRQYSFLVGHAARINGIKAAVEIYLVMAKTGRLPEKLPDYLPKDPFTGHDFEYEITDEGFTLRSAGKESPRRKGLEFKVRKEK
jgi:hypothetical protein